MAVSRTERIAILRRMVETPDDTTVNGCFRYKVPVIGLLDFYAMGKNPTIQ